jgi:hypothetical protein
MATQSQVAAVSPDAGDFLNDYLTEIQLAGLLKKDVRTLRRWDAERTGPPRTRAGKTILYRKSAVALWLEQNESRPLRRAR